MNKTQLRNLKKLPRVLRDESARRQKLGDRRMLGDVFRMREFGSLECGTPACVLGTYASREDVQKAFRLRKSRGSGVLNICNSRNNRCIGFGDPEVLEHFGIEEDEAEELFGAYGCDDAKSEESAASYIERFIADRS
jgi:hypothetical protein